MAGYVDTPTKIFEADAAIAKHARVTLESDGKIVAAGLTVLDIGTAVQQAFASGDKIAVRLRTATGTCKMIAIEALDAGALVYTEADGKIQDTAASTSFKVGHAMEAATADGDIIEVLRLTIGETAV